MCVSRGDARQKPVSACGARLTGCSRQDSNQRKNHPRHHHIGIPKKPHYLGPWGFFVCRTIHCSARAAQAQQIPDQYPSSILPDAYHDSRCSQPRLSAARHGLQNLSMWSITASGTSCGISSKIAQSKHFSEWPPWVHFWVPERSIQALRYKRCSTLRRSVSLFVLHSI